MSSKQFFSILTLSFILLQNPFSIRAENAPIVGAIRWDAWHGTKSVVGTTVEKQLSPKKWQYRVPFFGKIISDNTVEIRGYTQSIIDTEIAYAKRAGIDYWAFDLYPPSDAMSDALNLYLTSSYVDDVHFSFIVGPAIFQSDRARLLTLMAKPTYQKVLGNRPLVYIMDLNDAWINSWGQAYGGGMTGAKQRLDAFRADAQNAGLGNPYIVLIRFWESVQKEKEYAQGLGADAISRYLVGGNVEQGTYQSLVQEAARLWDVDKSSGVNVVPLLTTGLDSRPKVEIPNPWGTPPPAVNVKYYYQQPTAAQLADHVKNGVKWIQANPQSAPAQTALLYAWNENVEGGWLVPTLSEGTARIDALTPILEGVVAGDLNGDSKVNIFDFSIFMTYWWLKKVDKVDLNGDGKISIFDYAIFMDAWDASH